MRGARVLSPRVIDAKTKVDHHLNCALRILVQPLRATEALGNDGALQEATRVAVDSHMAEARIALVDFIAAVKGGRRGA